MVTIAQYPKGFESDPSRNAPSDRSTYVLRIYISESKQIGGMNLFSDDDRVVPCHSYKTAATLQRGRQHNRNPLLIRISENAGHGDGNTVPME